MRKFISATNCSIKAHSLNAQRIDIILRRHFPQVNLLLSMISRLYGKTTIIASFKSLCDHYALSDCDTLIKLIFILKREKNNFLAINSHKLHVGRMTVYYLHNVVTSCTHNFYINNNYFSLSLSIFGLLKCK